MLSLNDSITNIRGVGASKQEKLAKLGIYDVEDLLNHLPFRYKDKRKVYSVSQVYDEDNDILVCGKLLKVSTRQLSGSRSVTECTLIDDDCIFTAAFFNMPYIKRSLTLGHMYTVFGKLRLRNGMRVWTNPEIAEFGSDKDERKIIPVYRCTGGLTSNELQKLVKTALKAEDLSSEWLDEDIVKELRLCGREFAFNNIHFPEDTEHFRIAKYRLIFEPLLIYQLAVRLNRQRLDMGSGDSAVPNADVAPFINSFPFSFTEGQLACIDEIEKDLVSERPMNRLIQGDVGCGKTVVAETAMYKCAVSGFQAALMAPTELLARQHFDKISRDMEKFGIRCALLTSGMKVSERRAVSDGLRDGSIQIAIGTHALLSDDVEFADLALVVTDEQHRFGVDQRKTLVSKGRSVNVCVMSATPIPRTLAATVYGDMDFSIIRSKPSERREIITRCVDNYGRERAYSKVIEELNAGHQAYVVAPSIDSEDEDLSSVEALYSELSTKFKGFRVALLHGRMPHEIKDRTMERFASGEIDVLVTTVVIEVGIDVPNATAMVIENSERFGLAQMHQLRGRVGRSDLQSYCYLINYSSSESAVARAHAMAEMSDGFDISEADYRLRGPGDIMGTLQSGSFQSQILTLCRHEKILDVAVKTADRIMTDPGNTDMDYIYKEVKRYSRTDNSNIL